MEGYEPLSPEEVSLMTPSELQNVLSMCWRNNKYRCSTIGITNFNIDSKPSSSTIASTGQVIISNYFEITWSDDDGDPRLDVDNIKTKIDKIGDGEWEYGLYKKTKNKYQ